MEIERKYLIQKERIFLFPRQIFPAVTLNRDIFVPLRSYEYAETITTIFSLTNPRDL